MACSGTALPFIDNRPVDVCSSETWSKLIDMNNKNNGKLNIVETLITFMFKRFDLLSSIFYIYKSECVCVCLSVCLYVQD
jgi:hypothetical protein